MQKNISKIGFNGRPFCQDGIRGLSRHTLELIKSLKELQPDLEIYIYCYAEISPFYKQELPFAHFRDKNRRPKFLWDIFYLGRDTKKDGLDLFHSTNNLGVPLFFFASIPIFTTVHDTFTHEARRRWGSSLRSWWGTLNYYLELWLMKKSRAFFAVSESAMLDISVKMQIPLEKIIVAYNGTHFSSDQERRNESHYLYVGGFEERKNIKVLLLAFLSFWQDSDSADKLPLKLAGNPELASDEVKELLTSNSDLFILTGPVTDPELQNLYLGARALIFPSLEEGFGLPIVEAMALNCPVIASDINVFKEISKESALYFSAKDVESLKSKILLLDRDPGLRKKMREMGHARAQAFTWKLMAQKVYSTYLNKFKIRYTKA